MKNNITTNNWKPFKIENLFDVEGSITTKPEIIKKLEKGDYPYRTTQATNNGVAGFYNEWTDEGNVLTVDSAVTGTVFYESDNFLASDHVEKLIPKHKFNKEIAFFISTILNLQNYKYNYGRKRNQIQINKETILLPAIENNGHIIPDWEYMENYIKSLEEKAKTKLDNIIRIAQNDTKIIEILTNKIDVNNFENWLGIKENKQTHIIDRRNIKEYTLGLLFDDIYKATAHIKENTEIAYDSNGINFVSRTDNNNGVDFIANTSSDFVEKGNCLIIGDTTATIFYQKDDFIAGDHIIVLRAGWLNEYTGLYIKTILSKERYKFNYARSFNMDKINELKIKLPSIKINDKYEPDWEYMETYIKSLPYGDRI